MIILNDENNSKKELDKLSENCPDVLKINMKLDINSEVYCDWTWLIRINNIVYKEEDAMNKFDFIKFETINVYAAKTCLTINLKEVPSDIEMIEIVLNDIGGEYEYASERINKFKFHFYKVNKNSISDWVKLGYFNNFDRKNLYSKQITFGTFAKVSNGWKFYPKIEDLQKEGKFWIPTEPIFL